MAIKLGREIVRTLAAGVVVHFGMVMACSYEGGLPHYADEPSEGSRLDGKVTGEDGEDPEAAQEQTAQQAQPDASPLLVPVKEAKANESGSRLKARYYAGADGSRQFLNWYDSEVGASCYFARARDGALRCLPTTLGNAVAITVHYSDAVCSRLVFSYPTEDVCNDAAPAVGVMQDAEPGAACGQAYLYFRLAEKIQPNSLYTLSGSTCSQVTIDPARTYQRAGAELPISSFVSGEIVTE